MTKKIMKRGLLGFPLGVAIGFVIALIISVIINLLTNLAWLYAWNQYDYESETVTRTFVQDGEGLNIIGDSNEVTHGTTSDVYEEAQSQD